MIPRRFGNKCPKHNHQPNRRPQDPHGEEIIIRVFLVELLHHHRNDDASDVAPDLLEGDHAAADFVGTDFHHVDLADDLEDADSGSVAEFGECPCRRRFGGVEEYAALQWITRALACGVMMMMVVVRIWC